MTVHRLRSFFDPDFAFPWRFLERELSGVFNAEADHRLRVWTSDNAAIVELDTPGIDPAACDVSVEDDTVSISTPVPAEQPGGQPHYHLQERPRAAQRRQVRLPFPLDAARTDASYEHGVLRLKLERREDSKPARITVKAV